MKNKKRTIVTLFMALIASVCFAAGCSSLGGGKTDKPTKPDKIVMADFESWETGLQLIRTGAGFGKLSWNKDPAYVKDGIGSAKLQPLGGSGGGKAQFFYPTYSSLFGFDYRDFTDAKSVSVDFYNAEEEPLNVSIGLVPSLGSSANASNWSTTMYEFKELPSKQWTTIEYTINTSILAMSYDVTSIHGIYVAFEGVYSNYLKDAPLVYMDNIVLNKYQEAPPIENLAQLGENEYLDFEHPEWQAYTVKAMNFGDAPEISFVKSAEEIVSGTTTLKDADPNNEHLSGNYALKMVVPVGTLQSNWPGIEFSELLLQSSMFNGLDDSMYGATTFKFEMYNASSTAFGFGVRIYDSVEVECVYKSITVQPGEWATFEYNVKDLYDDYFTQIGNKMLFSDPGKINMRWTSINITEETNIYFDNMRFEVENIDQEAKPTIKTYPFIRKAEVGSLIDFPTVLATDKYDIAPKSTMKPYYKNGDTWEEVTTEKGKIPVSQVGDYKIVVTATNSLGGESVEELFFEGVESLTKNYLATYSYADEVNHVNIGTRTETNKVTFMEEATFGGETRQGVLKLETLNNQNGGSWGTGFVGFAFASEYLKAATEGKWKSITFHMCVTTEVGASFAYFGSSSTGLNPDKPLAMNKWVEFTVTKNRLNNGVTNSYLNTVKKVMADNLFYADANEAFGMSSMKYLFYLSVSSTSTELRKDPRVTYYIDEVTWEGNDAALDYEGEVSTGDIYDDEWALPDHIKKKEELE